MYTLTFMFIVVSLAVVSGLGTNNSTSCGELKFLVMCHFLKLSTSGKVHRSRKKMHANPICLWFLSVVSFLPGLGLMKTTVLESMCTPSYFRLDTLPLFPLSLSSTIMLRPLPLHFGSRTIFFTRRSPPSGTNTTWPWPAPFRLSHDHVAIASWSDQYYVARSMGTRLQKPPPHN